MKLLTRVLAAVAVAFMLALPPMLHSSGLPAAHAAPAFSHVYVIFEENSSYEDIIGNTTDFPYINQLAQTYGLAANYYGVTHPSEPNYVALIAGDFFGNHTDDPNFRSDAKNLVDQLEGAGLTWATYQQGMPGVGTLVNQDPPTGSGLYITKHNPFVLMNDIRNNPKRLQNSKPMDSLAADLSSPSTAPNFAFLVPDQCHDMHGVGNGAAAGYPGSWCSYPPNFVINHALFQTGDAYAKQLITQIMTSKAWTPDSLIVLTWDEAESSGLSTPNRGYAAATGCCASPPGDGGGRIPAIFITNTPNHTVSLTPYNHYSLLRTIEDNWGLGCLANSCDPSVKAMTDLVPGSGANANFPLSRTLGFGVTWTSKNPGQGFVLFGPTCDSLIYTATQDQTPNTTQHTIFVQGNDLPGVVGNVGLNQGQKYAFEVVTVTARGVEVDNNNGQCYYQWISTP